MSKNAVASMQRKQEMAIDSPSFMSRLAAKLAAYRPKQIARLAGMFSLILHLGIWQVLQAAVMDPEPLSLSQRIEVTLMSDAPKPIPPDTLTKPLLPAVVETEDIRPVAIPLPVADPMPIVKPLVKPKRKISKPPAPEKAKPPLLKREKPPSSATVPDSINDTGPGGSAGGYGVASQTGQGMAGSIGLGGGEGGGSGGGRGPGNAPGTGSGSGDAYSEASFNANYATNPKPKYPEEARKLGWEGNVLLRVRVSAEGHSEQVTVHRSSGHKVLDDSAVAAVQKWRFIPARRGNTAVACTVIVPIVFALN